MYFGLVMSSRFLSLLLGENINSYDQQFDTSNQDATAQLYETMAPFSLGTNQTKANKKRTRKEILTKWERMLRFAPIAEGMGCLLYTSPSPRDSSVSRMPSSA